MLISTPSSHGFPATWQATTIPCLPSRAGLHRLLVSSDAGRFDPHVLSPHGLLHLFMRGILQPARTNPSPPSDRQLSFCSAIDLHPLVCPCNYAALYLPHCCLKHYPCYCCISVLAVQGANCPCPIAAAPSCCRFSGAAACRLRLPSSPNLLCLKLRGMVVVSMPRNFILQRLLNHIGFLHFHCVQAAV